MIEGSSIYVVLMRRWGAHDTHCYILGAYTDANEAVDAGIREKVNRGGKYEMELLCCELNAAQLPDTIEVGWCK